MRSTTVSARSQDIGLIACEPALGTLRELLAHGVRPDREQLIDWGCQILGVLAEEHAAGLFHRQMDEDSVLVSADGRIFLTGVARTRAGDPQSDLHAVGSLLRRLSFATRLKSGGGVVGSNGRDPLFKVLARATFRDPAARYRTAADMAEALRQAGRARVRRPTPTLQLVSSGETARLSAAPVMPFPSAAHEQPETRETGDRRWVLLLLAVTLLLMLSVIATGWFLIGGETLPANPLPDKTSVVGAFDL